MRKFCSKIFGISICAEVMITDTIEENLPSYLSAKEQANLLAQLKDFQNRDYYTRLFEGKVLQGDAWSSLQVFNFRTGEKAAVSGIVFSNSCDIDGENPRDLPPKVMFAPVIPLAGYQRLLVQAKTLSTDQVEAKLAAIRAQSVTSIFYLPRGAGLAEECIVILDDVHSMPAPIFLEDQSRRKIFTLGQMGFYLFVLKLSIHFCRFREGIIRSSGDAGVVAAT